MKLIDAESFNENFQYYDNETIRMVVENFIEESEDRLKELEKNASDLNL